jgi:ectoine hydroxylase-related dioxygenase (phytanoyl-CoA dioxygenase family)
MNIISRQVAIIKNLYRERFAGKTAYKADASIGIAERKMVAQLHETGIVVVPGFLKPEDADTIKIALDNVLSPVSSEEWKDIRSKMDSENLRWGMKRGNEWSYWVNIYQSDFRLMWAEHIHSSIEQFAHDRMLMDVGSEYLQEHIKLSFCMANKTIYKPDTPGSGGGWHRDKNYKKGFKALVYLVDTDESNGCFQYIPSSSAISHHLLKANTPDKYKFTDAEVTAMISKESDVVSVCGKKGTLVLFDTNGVHRGMPLAKDGVRYALTNYYLD